MREYTISADAAEQRFDRYLSKLLVNAKKAQIQKWIRKKIISVNLKKAEPEYKLNIGDQVRIFLPDTLIDELVKKQIISPDEVDLSIVYEDNDILILDKPMGLLVHPNKTEFKNTLSSRVQHYLKHLITPTFAPASINRLDKNTGGMVLFCKNYESLKYYNELMKNGLIKKHYICIAHGRLTGTTSISGYLSKDEIKNKVELNEEFKEGSKYVLTHISPIEVIGNYSKLDIDLVTGRSHQIRASLSYIKHPILGDIKYGGKKYAGVNSQLLFAYKLEFEGKSFEIKNKKMEEVWKKLKNEEYSSTYMIG